MKTVALIIAGILVLGIMSGGGPVRQPDGKVDVGATLERGADEGGELAGRTVDDVGNSLGNGLGSAVAESDLAKVGAAAAAAAAAVKYGPKFKPKPAPAPTPTATTAPPPKRRTGWCRDVLTGAVVPCAPKPSSTSTTAAPMSSGWSAPTFKVPEATWKPCVVTPGQVVSC